MPKANSMARQKGAGKAAGGKSKRTKGGGKATGRGGKTKFVINDVTNCVMCGELGHWKGDPECKLSR